MKFSECPNCGNYEKGYSIWQCKKCQRHYCYKDGVFGASGCGSGSTCPNCKKSLDHKLLTDSSYKKVGYIKPNNEDNYKTSNSRNNNSSSSSNSGSGCSILLLSIFFTIIIILRITLQ